MKRLLVLLAACSSTRAPITGTQSIEVDLISPTQLGSIAQADRLPDTARTVTLAFTAKDAQGQTDTSFNNTLEVYVQFLGTLTPYLGGTPLAKVPMQNGTGMLSNFTLPPVFGPTTIWVDDMEDAAPTYATGVSPTLWYRDPFIADIRTPPDESAATAFEIGPLDTKNVSVDKSRYGATGRLVVTSVYSQGYTLADVNCSDAAGTPPCTSAPYDTIDVFSYSAPLDQEKRFLDEGQTIDGFAGGVSPFDGLLEIGFPQTFVRCQTGSTTCTYPDVNKAREPATVKMDATWFNNPIMFKRYESATIEVDNVYVCPLTSEYTQYHQWTVDLSGGGSLCTNGNFSLNIVATGIDIDPATLVGTTLPRVVGNERSINIGTFHVWTIYPRSLSDFTLPP